MEYHQNSVRDFVQSLKKEDVKDNIVFVQRSVLSPLLHGYSNDKEQAYNLMNKIKTVPIHLCFKLNFQELNGSLLVLECDAVQTHQRILYRYEVASDEDKKIRKELSETDEQHIQNLIAKYYEFSKEPIVEGVVNSTSIKQAVPSLFQALGIQFSFKHLLKDAGK